MKLPKTKAKRAAKRAADTPAEAVGADIKVSSDSPITVDHSKLSDTGLVTVTGFDSRDVLLQTNDAKTIQVRGADGMLQFLFVKKNDLLWLLCTPNEDDWDEMVRRFAAPSPLDGEIRAAPARVPQRAPDPMI